MQKHVVKALNNICQGRVSIFRESILNIFYPLNTTYKYKNIDPKTITFQKNTNSTMKIRMLRQTFEVFALFSIAEKWLKLARHCQVIVITVEHETLIKHHEVYLKTCFLYVCI